MSVFFSSNHLPPPSLFVTIVPFFPLAKGAAVRCKKALYYLVYKGAHKVDETTLHLG